MEDMWRFPAAQVYPLRESAQMPKNYDSGVLVIQLLIPVPMDLFYTLLGHKNI